MGMNGERERDLRRRRTGEGDLERDLESSVDGDLEECLLRRGDLLRDLDLDLE